MGGTSLEMQLICPCEKEFLAQLPLDSLQIRCPKCSIFCSVGDWRVIFPEHENIKDHPTLWESKTEPFRELLQFATSHDLSRLHIVRLWARHKATKRH